MILRALNIEGINEFRNQIQELKTGTRKELDSAFLEDNKYSDSYKYDIELEKLAFQSKREVSVYLAEKLFLNDNKDLYYDIGIWTWLSAYYFYLVCPKDSNGRYNIRAEPRYILADPKNWRRYYRHLLACPARLYCELGEFADPFLASPIHIWGDFHEQLTAYQEIATNKPLINTANLLYWNENELKLKRGSGSKGGGSPRRFSDVIGQFELTYDLNAMQSDQILRLLPHHEFKKWIPVA